MAQSGYTPIQLYYSTTAAAVPVNTNLASGELALNIQDEKLYFKNAAGTVKLLASNATSAPVTSFQTSLSGLTPSTATTGAVTLAGTLGTANGGTGLTSFTSGGVVYASSTSALATGSALTYDGQYVSIGTGASSPNGLKFLAFGGGPAANLTVNHSTGEIQNFAATNYFPTWYANNSEAMRISTAGNVGIGTSSPSNKLTVDINTASQATGITLQNSNAGGYGTVFNSALYGYAGSPAAMYNVLSMRTFYNGTTGYVEFYTKAQPQSTEVLSLSLLGNGNVGIGTNSPNYKLSIAGTANNQNSEIIVTATSVASGYLGSNANGFNIGTDTAGIVFKTGVAGSVGATGTERGRFQAGFSVGTTSDPGAGAIYATGNITAFFSDKRLKTVSGKIENALDKVAQLSGVYYTFNDTAKSFGYDSDEEHVGVLAQDVEAVLPQIVKAAPFDLDENNNSKSGENYKTVQYEKLVPLLIEAINELQAKVKALEAK